MNCKWCNKEFKIDYKRTGIPVFCSKACAAHGSRTTWTKDALTQAALNIIVHQYATNKHIPTQQELFAQLHVSSKTWNKMHISLRQLLNSLGIAEIKSKFQANVTEYVRRIFDGYEVFVEYDFEGTLLNPKTNKALRVDIFIPVCGLVIECDGVQHAQQDHYWNDLTVANGYTPSYITDNIKEEWLRRRGYNVLRISYSRIVNENSIRQLVESRMYHNATRNDRRECLKNMWIGQSAAKLLYGNIGEGSTTTVNLKATMLMVIIRQRPTSNIG